MISKQPRLKLRDRVYEELESNWERSSAPTREDLVTATNISSNTLDRLFNGDTQRITHDTRRRLRIFLQIDDAELESLLSDCAKPSAAVKSGPQKTRESMVKLTIVGISALLIIAATIHYLRGIKPDLICVIDLRIPLDTYIDCPGFGALTLDSPMMDGWNSEVTAVDVPEGWGVSVKYELWKAPEYEEIDPNGNGYVALEVGYNPFYDDASYPLYRDHAQTEFVRMTKSREMNDRIQFLVISSVSKHPLIIRGHKDPDDLTVISIQLR